MKKYFYTMALIPVLMAVWPQPQENPTAEIKSRFIEAKLHLPDPSNGYYRGTRFDWAGQIYDLKCNNHTYFGKWFENYSPTLHDAIMGPVEEFGPLGYDDTKPGESFIMIGIGALKKPEEKSHQRFGYYEITDNGKWKVKKKADEIQFIHILSHKGYSYEYIKTIRLLKESPVMEITHTLKNKGSLPVKTNVYNHNFFVMDNQQIGPGFIVTFPFKLSGDCPEFNDIAMIKDNTIRFRRSINGSETVFCGTLKGFSNNSEDFNVKIENTDTGAGVRITADKSLSKLYFWASLKTLCPETFIDLDIQPGKEFSWKLAYEFYSFDVKK